MSADRMLSRFSIAVSIACEGPSFTRCELDGSPFEKIEAPRIDGAHQQIDKGKRHEGECFVAGVHARGFQRRC